MQIVEQNITIVGAGPAGLSLALFLAKAKIPHSLIEKGIFPKDKTCSGIITPECIKALQKIDPKHAEELIEADWASPTYSIHFSEGRHKLEIDISNKTRSTIPLSIATKRKDFDTWLFSKLNPSYSSFMPEARVIAAVRKGKKVELKVETKKGAVLIRTDLVIGTDGVKSVIRKSLHPNGNEIKSNHHVLAIRQNWAGVACPQGRPLEMFTLDRPYPISTYVFYHKNGEAVVGIGTTKKSVQRYKVNLNAELKNFLSSDPLISKRFKNASPLEDAKGWGIPLNTDGKTIAGDHFLLIGDAGRFADRSFAKGIGTAMLGAESAAEVIAECVATSNYSKELLTQYQNKIEKRFRAEWRMLAILEQLSSSKIFRILLSKFLSTEVVNKFIERKTAANLEQYLKVK